MITYTDNRALKPRRSLIEKENPRKATGESPLVFPIAWLQPWFEYMTHLC